MREHNVIEIGTSQRSLTESSKNNIVNTVTSVFKLAKAEVVAILDIQDGSQIQSR